MIELMITVAVAAILLGIALPNMTSLLHKSRLATAANELYGSLNVARSIAINQQGSVSVCPSSNGNSCTDGNWSDGWIVFQDPDRDGVADDQERIVRWVSDIHDSIDIQSTGTAARHVTFNATGDARTTTGSFSVCHEKTSVSAKLLNVSAVGRVDLSSRNQAHCTFSG